MNTKKIVFVCFDNDYITALEFKMAEIVGNSADIEFITDVIYFQQYMSIPRRIDILVMPEGMKEALTNKVNVGKILYLTDEILQEEQDDLVYKYGSVRYLVEKIDNKIFDNAEKDIKKGTKVISVFSVCGGCGKTVTSLAVANNLHKKGNRVLYVSTQPLQDFEFYLAGAAKLSSEFSYQCTINIKNALKMLLREIKSEGFDYIPAFSKLPAMYQVSFETYVDMIEFISQRNMYDYIVVELSSQVSIKQNAFMHNCYRTLIVTTQEEVAVRKLETFLSNMADFSDKVTILCNRVRPNVNNYLESSFLASKYEISEYVTEGQWEINLQVIKDYQYFNKTTVCLE